MAKPKRKVTKQVSRKSTKKISPLQQLFHKKHRPLHTAGVGILLVLLKGILAVFATIGIALILISAFAYIWKAAKLHNQ